MKRSKLDGVEADLIVDVVHGNVGGTPDESFEVPEEDRNILTSETNAPLIKISTEGRSAYDVRDRFKDLVKAMGGDSVPSPHLMMTLDHIEKMIKSGAKKLDDSGLKVTHRVIHRMRGLASYQGRPLTPLCPQVGAFTQRGSSIYLAKAGGHPMLRALKDMGVPMLDVEADNPVWGEAMTTSGLTEYNKTVGVWLYDASPDAVPFHDVSDDKTVADLKAFKESDVSVWHPQMGFSDEHILLVMEEVAPLIAIASNYSGNTKGGDFATVAAADSGSGGDDDKFTSGEMAAAIIVSIFGAAALAGGVVYYLSSRRLLSYQKGIAGSSKQNGEHQQNGENQQNGERPSSV